MKKIGIILVMAILLSVLFGAQAAYAGSIYLPNGDCVEVPVPNRAWMNSPHILGIGCVAPPE